MISTVLRVPLLLCVFVGVSLGLVGWGVRRQRVRHASLAADSAIDWHDDLLVGMLIFAGLAVAVLLAYVLLGLLV
jgi:hypothetical protein